MSKNKFRRFSEYLTSNGKLGTTKIDAAADTGPSGAKTPAAAATKGRGWEAQVKSDKPKPYASVTAPVTSDFSMHPKGETNKGLAKDGDKKLIYNPKTPKDFGDGGKKLASWPKTTKEFLDSTQGMKISEFAEYLSDRNQIGNLASLIPSADPVMATHYVSALANANDGVMETLVREMKRLGCLDRLVAEIFKHPEAFSEVANLFDMNDINRLNRAINEARVQEVVDAPAEDTEEEGSKPRKNPKSIGGDKNKLDMSGSDVISTRKSKK